MPRNLDELTAFQKKVRTALLRTGTKGNHSSLRRAYLKVTNDLSDTQLDIFARLQFLEGALKSHNAKEKLEWTKGKSLRAALAEAIDFIEENYGILPEISRYTWLTKESTGFYRDVKRRLSPILKQVSTSPDDLMQMLLMGMNPSGETFYIDENNEKIELSRIFQAVGFKSRERIRQDFESKAGKLTPYDFTPILAAWAQRKALNLVRVEQRDKGRRERYWGQELQAPREEEGTSWDSAQDISSILPGEAVHEDWGAQSEAWAFSSMLFHTPTPEAQRVRDWLYRVVFSQQTAVDVTMRTLFDMLEEGDWDISGGKPLLRLQQMNAELARRVGKELRQDMGPNAKGQYAKLNAAREAGFRKITQVTEDLKKMDIPTLRAREESLQKFLEEATPLTRKEKSEVERAEKTLKGIRGKLALLRMLDAIEIAGMGFSRFRKAKRRTASQWFELEGLTQTQAELGFIQERFQDSAQKIQHYLVTKKDFSYNPIQDVAHRWRIFKDTFEFHLKEMRRLLLRIAELDPKQKARFERIYNRTRAQVSKLEMRSFKLSLKPKKRSRTDSFS